MTRSTFALPEIDSAPSTDAGDDNADAGRPAPRVPSAPVRHVLNRFTYGLTADLAASVRDSTDLAAWFEAQLEPANIPDPVGDELVSWFPAVQRSPVELWRDMQGGGMNVPTWSTDFQRWTMLRRLFSTRQVAERMAAFWSDLLYIPLPEGKSWVHRFSYDATIREHALGRFDDMLVAAETHPAMTCYLDNAGSTRTNLNENLGREVLELHTVGKDGGYSEHEVVASARILTGYRVRMWDSWEPYYSAEDHYVGPVQVLGFMSPNGSSDGRAVTEAYLRYLAQHPVTARRIAHRLCVRFVSDSPSRKIVDAVARTFRSSGTDIKATLRTLINHPEFLDSAGLKVRTPVEDVVATYRALRLTPHRPEVPTDLANVIVWHAAASGQRPFDWPRPDGPPDVAKAWVSVGRMLSSWRIHYTVVANAGSITGFTAPEPESWVPQLPARVSTIVDHATRLLLSRPATKKMIKAAALRMNVAENVTIKNWADLPEWRIQQMLGALLDTPTHFER